MNYTLSVRLRLRKEKWTRLLNYAHRGKKISLPLTVPFCDSFGKKVQNQGWGNSGRGFIDRIFKSTVSVIACITD